MGSKRINSVDDIQCGYVHRVPLIDEIEFYEEVLIPMIEEYGETSMNLNLDEVKKELIKMKEKHKENQK